MQYKCVFVAFLFILAISMTNASSYYLELNQIEDTLVVQESFSFLTQTSWQVNLPEDYEQLSILGNYSQEGETLYFTDFSASIVYVTQSGISSSNKDIFIIKKVVYSEDFNSSIVKLNLDKGVVIADNEAYPSGYNLETNGQKIALIWKLEGVSKGDSTPLYVNLEDFRDSELDYIWFGLIAFIVAFLVVAAYLLFKKYYNRSNSEFDSHLLDAEKKVIEELKKADRNELWQRQIQNLTLYSKAKVSRIIRNLEARGLIVKIPFGNTNKVRLK